MILCKYVALNTPFLQEYKNFEKAPRAWQKMHMGWVFVSLHNKAYIKICFIQSLSLSLSIAYRCFINVSAGYQSFAVIFLSWHSGSDISLHPPEIAGLPEMKQGAAVATQVI